MHDLTAAFWEHNTVYKIRPQRNLRPSTVRIQVDIEGGTQDGVTDIGIVTDIGCYQITQCDVGVSCIRPAFMQYSNGTRAQCYVH